MKYPFLVLFAIFAYTAVLTAGNSQANDLLIDAQGALLTVGLADSLSSNTTDFAATRYLADGSLDTSFNPSGLVPGILQIDLPQPVAAANVLLEETNEGLVGVKVDQFGGIVGVGFSTVGLTSRMAVLKLNRDGSLDSFFNANGLLGPTPGLALINVGQIRSAGNDTNNFTSDTAAGVALDSKGRIIVAGTTDNGQNLEMIIARLLPDGSLDTSFNAQSNTPGIVTLGKSSSSFSATAVALNPDDSIVVGGSIVTGADNIAGATTSFIVAKFSENGVLDELFNQLGETPGYVIESFNSFDSEAFALKIDSEERIIIGGFTQSLVQGDIVEAGSIQTQCALARYTKDGTLDTLFNSDSSKPGIQLTAISKNNDSIRGLALTPDDKILATGFTDDGTNRSFVTLRYRDDGTLDPDFNPNGLQPGVVVTTVATIVANIEDTAPGAQNEGHALVVGQTDQIFVAGFSSDGLQTNVTVLSLTQSGEINPLFNPSQIPPGRTGIVITPFGQSISSLGNGIPLLLSQNAAGVAADIVEKLSHSPVPIAPHIVTDPETLETMVQPVIFGYASPNANITLYINDMPVAQTRASSRGSWQVSLVPFAEGTYEMVAISTDPLVGLSLASAPIRFGVEINELQAPQIITPKINEQFTQKKISIKGTAVPNSLVAVTIDAQEVGSIRANAQGSWQFGAGSLSEGTHKVNAYTITKAGAHGPSSESVSFTIELTIQKPPRILSPTPGFVCVQADCILKGEGTPGTTVNLMMNGKKEAEVSVGADGTWRYATKGLNGEYELYVTCGSIACRSEKVRFRVEDKSAL